MEKSRSVSFLSFGRLLKARNHNFEEGNPMRKNQLVVKLGYSIGYCILHTCILKIGLAKKSVATVRTGTLDRYIYVTIIRHKLKYPKRVL